METAYGGRASRIGGWPPSSLLGSLEPAARDRLLSLGVMIQYPGLERVLMREGEETTFALVLLDGVVKATGTVRDGTQELLAIRVGGDMVGEFAAIDGRPRSATITTCGTVVARAFSRADLRDCMRRDPEIAQAIKVSVVAKLRDAGEQRIELAGCDVTRRLARVIHEIALTYGEPAGDRVAIRCPLTQPELATLAKASDATVSKALRRLREAHVVVTGYRSVAVADLSALHQAAYG